MHWQPLDQVGIVLTDYHCNYLLSLTYPLFLVAWWLGKPLSTCQQSPHGEAGCSLCLLSITMDILCPRFKPSQPCSRYMAILLGDLGSKLFSSETLVVNVFFSSPHYTLL
ncbi:hypothetical protein COCMIDRAFT_87647 [Bipolaris oryzae ATCC 44560]|uniref:Uncharacterized protein n=1 Tax=Bipolaris oryzae ATCC 44560 TaxID=930090 RepID=W6ZEA8_COCMI|nr:uncharacterized protein COCMIDRAFT_87647 [Bipolaris oryzae ATCC 44560]EUC48350.1 hypothetical protein COCMIDRAFT_87647 [Bipolaris oryzae ATCC 44560]